MLQLVVPDTGLGPTGTDIVSSGPGSYSAPPSSPASPGRITAMSPSQIPAGVSTVITLTGVGFVPGVQAASLGLTVQSTVVVDSSHVRVTATPTAAAGLLAGSITYQLGLTLNSAQSNTVPFQVTKAGVAAPVTTGGATLPPTSTLPPNYTLPPSYVPPLPELLNVDRTQPPAAPPQQTAPAFQLQGPTGSAEVAPTSSSATLFGIPWWLLLLAFLFGRAS